MKSNKKFLLAGICFCNLLFCLNAYSFELRVANQTDEKVTIRVNRWDHEIPNYPYALNLYTGEHEAGEIFDLGYEHSGHLYSIDVNGAMWSRTDYIEFVYDDENPPPAIDIYWNGCNTKHKIRKAEVPERKIE